MTHLLQVNFQALKTNYERDLVAKEEQAEEARRKLTLQLRELEGQMEEERKQRTAAQNGRKKLESDLHDLQVQLDAEGKGKEELQRQLKKVQVSACSHGNWWALFTEVCMLLWRLYQHLVLCNTWALDRIPPVTMATGGLHLKDKLLC